MVLTSKMENIKEEKLEDLNDVCDDLKPIKNEIIFKEEYEVNKLVTEEIDLKYELGDSKLHSTSNSSDYISHNNTNCKSYSCNSLHDKHQHIENEHFECFSCDYKTTQKDYIAMHVKIHERPFKCSVCLFSATSRIALTKHMVTHGSEGCLKCSDCDYQALNKRCLSMHIKRKHSTEKLYTNVMNVRNFLKYTHEEKINLKKKGRPLPDIIIENTGVSRGKTYKRQFSRDIYNRNSWICGCNETNALFCFPCLLFNGDKAWTKVGVTDLVHLSEKIKKHENSKTHLHNAMELALLGTVDIRSQLSSAYWVNLQQHNDNVTKNRYVLSKIINCIKFCGAFELALRGHNESDSSQNLGIFRGLINFSAELDSTLSEHLKNASVFKSTSKEIQNDLLDCILEVCHEEIASEIEKASFLSVVANETTDVSAKTQMVVILRYTRNGEPVERFWKYLNPSKCDVEVLTESILSIIDPLTKNSPTKLIGQSYDGAAVMSGQHAGVQTKIKEKYPFAHFVHCYAHQLHLIISKAASANPQVRVFFGNLQDIPEFFNNSPQCIEVLNNIMERKVPHGATTRWNLNVHIINIVFENRESLIECMEEIVENFTQATVCSAANSIRRTLQDPVFVFWLTFFHHVMPHVDILFNQLQNRKTDITEINHAVDHLEQSIIYIQNTIDDIINEASNICTESPESKRKHPSHSQFDHRVAALEVCDIVRNSIKDRFIFQDHLVAASLFFPEHFREYCTKFPDDKLTTACLAYPALEKERLRTELSVIYSRSDCREINGVLPLLKFLIKNNLDEPMRETKKILEIIVTTPMTTPEEERCFSTLKRIKTFLQNSMSNDRLTALSMISIEKKFISEIENFNEKVIDKFSTMKDQIIELIYK